MKTTHMTLILVALAVAGGAEARTIRTTVDGDLINFTDVQPTMMNGRVMVPIRDVFENMNASVVWDDSTRSVVAQHEGDTIQLKLNAHYATINDRQVALDAPARFYQGRTVVPLRFLSEALKAKVQWVDATDTVEIMTNQANDPYNPNTAYTKPISTGTYDNRNGNRNDNRYDKNGYTALTMETGTVMPFKLDEDLSSNNSTKGDKFTATLDTDGASNYQGMPEGTVFEGHVDTARAKDGNTPGVLGLTFDRIRLPDGQTYKLYGSLIGLDSKSVLNKNGKITAKSGAKKDNLKYVGYGAGAGVIVAVLTKGNILTTGLIGGALGYLFGEIQKDPSKANDVSLDSGTRTGVRLTRQLSFRGLSSFDAQK